jgi:Protein of unknown function (DUF3105)
MRAALLLVVGSIAACGTGDYDPSTSGTAGIGGSGGSGLDGGCSGSGGAGGTNEDATAPDGDFDAISPDAETPPSDGGCNTVTARHPTEGALHVAICSPVTYGSNPPSSGNHYPVWADYKTYNLPIPRGFWVHSLEHGAVVITYKCPGGCAAEVAEAQAFIDALPADCGSGTRRLILAPDPDLDVRFAASAWGFTLRSNCFDRAAFQTFYDEHYNHAPEAICGGGTDPTGICGDPVCP